MTIAVIGTLAVMLWFIFCLVMLVLRDDWNWFLIALVGPIPVGLVGAVFEHVL